MAVARPESPQELREGRDSAPQVDSDASAREQHLDPRASQDAATALTVPAVDRAPDVYSGTHKLGVNRVTDMARVGTATFSRSGGVITLEARVARGSHWLSLSGEVQPRSEDEFVLTGVMQGTPDMAWAGERPRERRTQGRFTFQVKQNRPYWRLYKVNDRPCVCQENCGNDFCYVDIERAPSLDQAQ